MLIRIPLLIVAACIGLFYWYMQGSQPWFALPFALGALGYGWMLALLLNREIADGRNAAWDHFITWCAEHAQRHPYSHISGYMRRYWLIRIGTDPNSPAGTRYPRYGVRLHYTTSSDVGHFHDHPWPSISLILRGGYWELRPILDHTHRVIGVTRDWCGPGRLIFRRAGTWHRLELASGRPCTSLFAIGRKRHGWGFLVDGRKVPWREYHTSRFARAVGSSPA